MGNRSEHLSRGGIGNLVNPALKNLPPDGGRIAKKGSFILFVAVLLPVLLLAPLNARGVEITPFYSQNQSPFIQIFGLPAAGDAKVVGNGKFGVLVAADVANSYFVSSTAREDLMLDGESYRFTLGLRYGLSDRFEVGIDIPYVGQGGGFLDSFIMDWHKFFGLPQGGRTEAPKNRLLYDYSRDGQNRLLTDDSSFSIGDIRLYGAMQLYNDGKENPRAVALRASVKVPSGDSHKLHGSGSTDGALWLTASDDYKLPAWLGHFTLFGAVGGMGMTSGDILRDQQRNVAGFFTFGFGWGPASWIALKAQVSGHTPFYQSELRELGKDTLQLIVGGTLGFTPTTSLDIGVSEDVVRGTSPDVAFHLALKQLF